MYKPVKRENMALTWRTKQRHSHKLTTFKKHEKLRWPELQNILPEKITNYAQNNHTASEKTKKLEDQITFLIMSPSIDTVFYPDRYSSGC